MASFNRPRFPGNNAGYFNNYGPTNMNNRSGMPGNMFPYPGPPRMIKNEPPQVQRYGPNVPVGFLGRPPFQRQMNRNSYFPDDTYCSQRMSGPMVPPPFPGTSFFDNRDSRFQMQNSDNSRFFTPWNKQPFESRQSPFQNRRNDRRNSSPWKNESRKNLSAAARLKRKKKKYDFRKKLTKPTNKTNKPWMTDEIKKEVLLKNELYVKAKSENTDDLWGEFRLVRNRVSGKIKDAKFKAGLLPKKSKEPDLTPRPHFCDNCDRAFITKVELAAHCEEHITCSEEGCTFEAHPKIISLHKSMQHATGFAKRIQNITSPEDIQKWITERKSRYPTMEVIQKKKEEEAEKVARGEVIETKEFGKFKKRRLDSNCGQQPNSSNTHGRKPHWRNRGSIRTCRINKRPRPFTKNKFSNIESDCSDDDSHIQLPHFKGMSSDNIDNDCNNIFQSSSDTCSLKLDSIEIVSNNVELSADMPEIATNKQFISPISTNINAKQIPISCDTLLTDDPRTPLDSHNEPPLEIPIEKTTVNDHLENQNNISNEKSMSIACETVLDSDDEAPSEIPILRQATNKSSETIHKDSLERRDGNALNKSSVLRKTQNSKDVQNQRNYASPYPNGHPIKSSKKPNLLEKLLAKEISHEKNVIFQCVRYVVENDCFGVRLD